MIEIEKENPGTKFYSEFKWGSDEASGFKVFMNKPAEPGPPPSKKPKVTQSLFSTQAAIVRIIAKLPDGTVYIVYENEHVNSIHGHIPIRHANEKEDAQVLHIFLILKPSVHLLIIIHISDFL